MSNPNPEVYGAPETWQNAYNADGINSETAENLKCGKIKIPNFAAPDTGTYTTSQIRTAVSNNKIIANVPIDNTICAVGQGNKSPFKKIACYYYDNEDTNNWYGPYITEITTPVNMFPYETYSANTLQGINGGFTNLNFEPLSSGQAQIWSENGVEIKYYNGNPLYYNANWRLAPFTYYQLKSIVLQVYVNYTTNTSEPMTDAGLNDDHWIALDTWKNSFSQYPIVGCKVRMISAYQISGENIEYYNYVGENHSPYRSAFGLGLNHPIIHNGNGDTFLSYTTFKASQINSDVIIFDKCYNLGGWGKYSKLCLSMWDRFSSYIQKPSNKAVLYRIPYSDTVYEELMQAVASLGFCFTPTAKTTFNKSFTDVDMCIPVINDDGVTTGEYTRGTDNPNNDLYNADSVRDKNYNPAQPVDPNTYSNITGFNSISAGASATERYVLDAGNTRQLLNDLWTISHDIAGVDYDNYNYKILDSFLVTNPIDCIISLKRFPFDIPHTFNNVKTSVNLGKNHGAAKGYLTYNAFNTVQFSGVNIFPRFGNSFLDYAPYTEYELYVPFCGTLKLNAGDILGHTLNCRLQIDLITGACTAYIMADSLVIETMTGTVSCELALSGIDSATIDANIQNSVLNHVNARTNKEVSMLSPLSVGGLVSAVSNPFKTAGNISTAKTEKQRAEYELTHIQAQPHTMGTAGGLTGWYQEFNARLLIYYPEGDVISDAIPPKLKNLANYGHTTGFATIDNNLLANYSGYTVATNAILNFAATTTEKEMIESALNGGVFI